MNFRNPRCISLFASFISVVGASQLNAQPPSVRTFEWANGMYRDEVHINCADPWNCIVSITTVTRGGVTVHDVFDAGMYPPSTNSAVGSVTLGPAFHTPNYPVYPIASGSGVICLETREWYRETPVVWTKRGHEAFKKTTHLKGYRVLWGRDAHGGVARVCFAHSHTLLYSEFTAQDELIDKRIDLESFRTLSPGVFSNFWWADAFTVLPNGNLLFVRTSVTIHSEMDSLGVVGRDSVEASLGYYVIDIDDPEHSRFGSADLARASMGSFPARMGRQAECIKNSQGEIWFLVETQGYRDPSDRTGFLDTSVTSLTLVSFVIDGETVSLGSNSHPRLAPSTQIADPIQRIICIDGEDTIDGIKIIDIGKDGAIFIDQF